MSADKYVRTSERKVRFGQHTCFLCSAPLRSKNRTDEHVFPKWLQHRFNLWNQQLDLINLTGIRYRQLTIPCCKTCNGVHLSKIENQIQKAVEAGPDAVADLSPSVLYMWLSKIFFGILYREHLLVADRRVGKRKIIPKEALRELRLHHDFMQGIRRSLEFPLGIPGSILIFGTSVPDRTEEQFDFLDNHPNLSLALRMGSVGIVCCLQDGGMTKAFHDRFEKDYHRENRLHPLQFREVTARTFYKVQLLESTALYIVAETPEKMQIVTQMPPHVSYGEWDLLMFCKMLGQFWNQPVEEIYGGERGWASSLKGEDDKFLALDPNQLYKMVIPDKWKSTKAVVSEKDKPVTKDSHLPQ
jgi:hypothetical protein